MTALAYLARALAWPFARWIARVDERYASALSRGEES